MEGKSPAWRFEWQGAGSGPLQHVQAGCTRWVQAGDGGDDTRTPTCFNAARLHWRWG